MKTKINVLGSNTTVVVDAIPPEQDAVGLFVPPKNIIVVERSCDQKFKNFSHELMHLLIDRSGIKQTEHWSADVEEILCENFSVMMDENWKQIERIRTKMNSLDKKKK